MTPEQRERIILSQRDALRRNGFHPNALFWSNQEVQELRFQVLANIGIQSGNSLLDIGCGFGDFAAYLKKQEIPVVYTGIDISAALLSEGKNHYPDLELIEDDLLDYDPDEKSYDYVMLSGALNRKFMGNQGAESSREYSYKIISRMFETCSNGIAFNLLDARHEWTAGRWDLQSFQPDDVSQFVSQFTSKFQLIDDYLENDFTVYAWRE